MLLPGGRAVVAESLASLVRTLSKAPRRLLTVVSVLFVAVPAQVVLGVCGRPGQGTHQRLWSIAQVSLLAVALAAAWWVIAWRTRRSLAERRIWEMLSVAWAILTASGLAMLILALAPVDPRLMTVPAALGSLIAFPWAYRAVVRWSRDSTGVDPDDLLNGISSVLVVVAVIGCALAWSVPQTVGLMLSGIAWSEQLLGIESAAWIILVLAALTAASVSRLYLDARIWLVASAYAMIGAGGVSALLRNGILAGWAFPAWSLALLLMGVAALRPVRFVPTEASDPVKSTVGAFVVVSAGLGILVIAVLTHVPGIVALAAAASILGSSVRLLINLRELVQLAASRAEALTDDLTGATNRRGLLQHLHSQLSQGRPLQLVVFDLDHFKEVNDGLGHSAGDDLLRMVTRRLRSKLPPAALLGRLGGDEFAVVSSVGDLDGSDPVTLKALEETVAEPFLLAGMSLHIDLSIGVTIWQPPVQDDATLISPAAAGGEDAASLLRQADTAMYDAKRNDLRAVTYDPARHADPRGLLSMVGELRRAISTGQLRVHYQPQLHTGSRLSGVGLSVPAAGALAGAEALVRWHHPRLGLLMPGQFLPLAESHGLMDSITREVLAQAVAQQARWRAAGRDVRVSVNLSAGTLLDASLPQLVEDLLDRYQVPATSLVLEVTETALLREPERSQAVVEALRARGAPDTLDDFGTGYSSLTQLRQLPVSELKLDRSFTVDLLTDARAAAIVANTIALAHDLQLRVVAEGVEDESTLDALTGLACDETQGYLHAKPLPPEGFDAWLRTYEKASADAGEDLAAAGR